MQCQTFRAALYKDGKQSWVSPEIKTERGEWHLPESIKGLKMHGESFRLVSPTQLMIPDNSQYNVIVGHDNRITHVLPLYDPFFTGTSDFSDHEKHEHDVILEFVSLGAQIKGTRALYFDSYVEEGHTYEEASWKEFPSRNIDKANEISMKVIYVLDEQSKYFQLVDDSCVPSKTGINLSDCEKHLIKTGSTRTIGRGNSGLLWDYIGGKKAPEYRFMADGTVQIYEDDHWKKWEHKGKEEEKNFSGVTLILIIILVLFLIAIPFFIHKSRSRSKPD